jgi:hypothetical protein
MVPSFGPSRYTARYMTKLVKEMGTAPMGMDIGPNIHIRADINAMTAI